MEDERLDDLFKIELEKVQPFGHSQKQWAVVNERLNGKSHRRFFIMALFGFLMLLSFGLFNLISQSENSFDQEQVSKVRIDNLGNNDAKENENLSSSAPSNKPSQLENKIQKSETIKLEKENADLVDSNTKGTINSKSDLMAVTNAQDDKISNLSSDEKCDCPDDELTEQPIENFSTPLLKPIEENRKDSSLSSNSTKTSHDSQAKLAGNIESINIEQLDRLPNLSLLAESKETSEKAMIGDEGFAECGEYVPPKARLMDRLNISVGLTKEFSGSEFQDSTNMSPYFGIGFKVHRDWMIALNFNQFDIDWSFGPTFSGYTVPDQYYQPPGEIMAGKVNYKTQQLNARVYYQIYERKDFGALLSAGPKFSNRKAGELSLTYEDIYDPITLDFEIPKNGWKMSAFNIGTKMQLQVIKHIGFHVEYNYIIGMDQTNIEWPNSHQLFFGLNFNL